MVVCLSTQCLPIPNIDFAEPAGLLSVYTLRSFNLGLAPRGVFYEKTLPLPYVSLFPVDYGFRLGILFELPRDTAGSGY